MQGFGNMFVRFVTIIVMLLFLIACSPQGPDVATQDNQGPVLMANVGVPGDGNVLALSLVETLRYMRMATQGTPNTFIMIGPKGEYFFAWAMKSNVWGFLGIEQSGAPFMDPKQFCGSNYSNCLTFTGLVKLLENQGWRYILPGDLPPWIATACSNTTQFLTNFSTAMMTPMIFIIPGATPFVPDLFETVQS